MKRSAHSKAVLDDSWITVDTTPLTLLFSLSHSESEQYKLLDSKSRSGLGKEEVCVWPPTKLEKKKYQPLVEQEINRRQIMNRARLRFRG